MQRIKADMATFSPIHIYRLARYSYLHGWNALAVALKLINFLVFKSIIPPEADIGERVVIMHQGVGLVIHPNCTVGDDVCLYHNVTLGTGVPRESSERLIVGDKVTIYASSVIIGPRRIGANSVIGAGSIVTHDIPENSVVYGNPARVQKQR